MRVAEWIAARTLRPCIKCIFNLPPMQWIWRAHGRHAEALLREIFNGHPYSVRYVLFGDAGDDSEASRRRDLGRAFGVPTHITVDCGHSSERSGGDEHGV